MKLIEKIRYQVGIRAVCDALDITEGVLGYHCPFHDDKTGSLLLKETENRFTCTVCKKSGTAIDLVKKLKAVETDDAVRWIAERFNIEEDSEFEENLLSEWKTERDAGKPTLLDLLGKSEEKTISQSNKTLFNTIYDLGRLTDTLSIFLEHKGFTPDQVHAVGFRILEKPRLVWTELLESYSKDDLDAAGLLDRNREFIFQQHNVLVPFYENQSLVFLAGLSMGGGKYPIVFPKGKNIPPYLTPDTHNRSNLFVVEDLQGAFAFYRMGFRALALPGRIDDHALSHMNVEHISICGEKSDQGNRFNRNVIQLLTESGIDFVIRETAPCFETFLDYISEKRK